MRVAALYDIHGNLPALEAVLEDVRRAAVDQVVVGGDLFPGPMCDEALDALLGFDVPVRFLHGNGDREVLAMAAGEATPGVPEKYQPSLQWLAARLPSAHRRLMGEWPGSVELRVDGLGDVLFCHATPLNDTDIFTRETPENRLLPMFQQVQAPVVVCGHTHMQFDRTIGGRRVVNAGSVGMPFGEPGACWLLLGPGIHLRRTDYDLTRAAERLRATAYPLAGEFAERYVLRPPSEQAMLDLYATVERK